ncbi:pyruvate carboxylase, partial [Parapusillimonas sp. SGNA-6]|nr:pyruvate carboxylase [Parapusillimonas sp. SGNA-6]
TKGKTLLVKLVSIGPPDGEGCRTVFFKLNGQTRNLEIRDVHSNVEKKENRKIDSANSMQIGSPLQGMLCEMCVSVGDAVSLNQPLFVIEAMKMESTITSPVEGIVGHIELPVGTLVKTEDLIVEIE